MNLFDPITKNIIVVLNESFTIKLQEQSFIYMKWESELPNNIELVDKEVEFDKLIENVSFKFISKEIGESVLLFNYRKQCCDKRLVTTQTYNITTVACKDDIPKTYQENNIFFEQTISKIKSEKDSEASSSIIN